MHSRNKAFLAALRSIADDWRVVSTVEDEDGVLLLDVIVYTHPAEHVLKSHIGRLATVYSGSLDQVLVEVTVFTAAHTFSCKGLTRGEVLDRLRGDP